MESFLIFISFVIILGFSVAFVVGVWLLFLLYLTKTHKDKEQYESLVEMLKWLGTVEHIKMLTAICSLSLALFAVKLIY